jgi:two-component system response regulator CpxR
MLTARGQDEDRILGLELGADDYLAKPFNPRELAARVRAILRRLDRDGAGARPPLRIGPLELEPARLRVRLGGTEIRLTAAEFLVLEALARAAGRVQSRAILTEHALGRPLEAYDRSIDTHVANLRRKLGFGAGFDVEIKGVRGAGYVLTAGASAR